MEGPTIAGSGTAINSTLDVFSIPLTDISIVNSEYMTYFPVNSYQDSMAPIEFHIPATLQQYYEPFSSFLFVECKIVKSTDGAALATTDKVAPCSNFLHALFDTCEVLLNGTSVSKCPQFYSYGAAIQNILNQAQPNKKNTLSSELFYRDSVKNKFDDSNKGFKIREVMASESKSFQVVGKLADGFFQQLRCIGPNVDIKIRLTRSTANFALVGLPLPAIQGHSPYKIQLQDVVFHMKTNQVSSNVLTEHARLLKGGGKYKYPMTYYNTKMFTIPKTAQSLVTETLFSGYVPQQIIIGLVDQKAISGDLKYDPFCFEDFNVSSVTLNAGDQYQYKRVKVDKDNFMIAYQMMASAYPYNGLDRKDYNNGNFLIVFDLVPKLSPGFQVQQIGQIKFELNFSVALESPICAFVLGRGQSLLQIDQHNNVINDASGF